jgi:hypothetical protein
LGNVCDISKFRTRRIRARRTQAEADEVQLASPPPPIKKQRDGTIELRHFSDGSIEIALDGIYITDRCSAMADAIQLAEFARSRYTRRSK